ncbi:MAG: YdcF family protein [Phormidesmis priestleyi]|uniref:YdcF family protein n=1 Tax=Phormidesmis priestleyi TaxID=268141 RepID=A0A2W4XLC7_9CYAN|nr:MAG: YdcF family protein [Phormidesmis priestleyi]
MVASDWNGLSMLDSALCPQASPTGVWTKLSWAITEALSQPGLYHPAVVIGILVSVAIWPWVWRRDRWKKPVMAMSLGLLVVYLAARSPILTGIGNQLLVGFIPADSGEKAEAIVVLGRGAQHNPMRAQVAERLWQAKRAPLIFASGRGDAPLIADLVSAQVPKAAVSGEPCSLTTNQNAEFTAALLMPQGVHTIVLVTDAPHMLRSLLTFKSFGFKVIPHISPLNPNTEQRNRRFLVFRESIGLVSYGLLGRYFSREAPPPSVIYVHPHSKPHA